MTNNELLKSVAPPFGDLYIRKESFTEYRDRVTSILPNFPENVLEHWLYRHFEFIDPVYLNLGLKNMIFHKALWTVEQIYNDIKPYEGDSFDGMGHHVYNSKTWLSQFMLDYRTFPQPIIILENLSLKVWGSPFHLLEGHQRLDYFREIYRRERETLKVAHELWIVKLLNQ